MRLERRSRTLPCGPAWQAALERGEYLASSPTLCRLENRANRQAAFAFHRVSVKKFIASLEAAPAELILAPKPRVFTRVKIMRTRSIQLHL